MKKILLPIILFLTVPIVSLAQDYSVTGPYTSPTRTTCGAVNNCGLRGSEDHEYQITIPSAGSWTFSLCGASYDTYLFVGTTLCSNNIASNDDFCGLDSELTLSLAAGTYYVTIEGYSASGCGTYSLAVTCTGCCAGPPVAEFSAPTTVCYGSATTFTDASTCAPTSWSWSFPGGTPATSTAQNPVVTYPAIGTYDVTLTATNASGSDVELKSSYINVIDCAGSCSGNYYYIRSNLGSPWGSTSNDAAMDAVFGAGIWTQEYFQTANPASLFSAATCTIFMDGSDFAASEFETFTNANMIAMENWVAAGGRLFLNAAPNEGDGLSYGFGGTTMNYPNGFTGTGTTVLPAHAIFNGPFLPVGTAWTGNWFAHGSIGNAGTSLIEESGNIICSEKIYGAGVVVFGSMTSSNWHTPATEGQNLRQNILCYISPPIICGTVLPVELSSFTGRVEGEVNVLEWITATEHNSDYFSIERSTDAKEFSELSQVDAAGSSLQELHYSVRDNDPFSGVTYYRLKQVDVDGQFEYSDIIALDSRNHADVSVFPSPTDNIITVTLMEDPEMTIPVVVRNAVGKTVHVTEFDQRVEIVDVSDLPSGVYFITMMIGGQPTVQKFCVK
jgi:PKD repeat protein